MRRSSVATMTSFTRVHFRTRSTTCCTSGRPVSEARILAGKRVDPKRAGITTIAAKVAPGLQESSDLQTAGRIYRSRCAVSNEGTDCGRKHAVLMQHQGSTANPPAD